MKHIIKQGGTVINGIILTPRITEILDYLQTGGTINWDNWDGRTLTNHGVKNTLSDIDKVTAHFTNLLLDGDEEVGTSVKMMRKLGNVRYIIESLALPDEIINKQGEK